MNGINKKNEKECLILKEYSLQNGEKLPLFQFPLLEETKIVKHCFTTRLGGVSKGVCSSFNLSFARGDDKNAVLENYRRLAEVMNVKMQDFVFSDQTHTTNVLRVGAEHRGCGITKPREYSDIDGLITNESGVVLSTFYADCVPLYFVDPVHKAIGLSHSGWKGTVARMGQKTLEAMHEAFGTEAKDVYVAIGPSICQDCYEVSEDVAEQFYKEFQCRKNKDVLNKNANKKNEGIFSEIALYKSQMLMDKGNGKYQLDLWKANAIVLLEAGILKEHLTVTNVCTCCNPNLLFSHRASHGKRGNLGAFLMLSI
ncbi:MAG: peptidoglycan editing factor PgeF [Lachnospiraceae bacterium]|nr:peptidoglycan editing factor PgeF [Lachnospiraceae bacterium]